MPRFQSSMKKEGSHVAPCNFFPFPFERRRKAPAQACFGFLMATHRDGALVLLWCRRERKSITTPTKPLDTAKLSNNNE